MVQQIEYVADANNYTESNRHGRIWGISSSSRVPQVQNTNISTSSTGMSQSEVSQATILSYDTLPNATDPGEEWVSLSRVVLFSERLTRTMVPVAR